MLEALESHFAVSCESGIYSFEEKEFSIDSIEERVKTLFINAFLKSYEAAWKIEETYTSLEKWLGIQEDKSCSEWLESGIEREILGWKEGKTIPIFFFLEGELRGFISLNPVQEIEGKQVVYGRQGALDPLVWGQKRVPQFFESIDWTTVAPEAELLAVLVRKINTYAIKAYEALGFKQELGLPAEQFGYGQNYVGYGFDLNCL